jgi:hypothetical protein
MIARIVLTFVALLALGQRQASPPSGSPGPWDNDVQVFHVDRLGRAQPLATFPRAGVATIARFGDGRLIAAHQYFPDNNPAAFDKVAVRFSQDEGQSWTEPQVIRLSGLPEGMRFPFDPTLVPLPDKRIRMYFTSVAMIGADAPAIYSAISSDGLTYAVEPGRRFGIEGRPVIDSAVVLHRGTFHLYAPRSEDVGFGYHATSTDGLTFRRADDVKMDGKRRWLGAAVSDGRSITFFGTGEPDAPAQRLPQAIGAQAPPGAPQPVSPAAPRGTPKGGIWAATSRNGQSWQPIPAPAVPGADPGAVATRDDGWIFVATGPPRMNTPSAQRPGAAGAPASRGAAGATTPALPPAPFDGGPRNHRLVLASSTDGLTWTLANDVFAEHASVPALFEGPNGRLIALFVDAADDRLPGALSARVEQSDGTWIRRETNLRGADPDVVRLNDGSYRAYTKEPDGSIPVSWSADGLTWKPIGTAFRDARYGNATDPDVFDTGHGWVMLLSLGPQLLRATSADGLTFTATGVADLGGSVSSTVKTAVGWRTYFHVNASPQNGGRMIIRSASTTDGLFWRVDAGNRLVPPPEGPARYGVADPAPVRRSDGSWVMLVKSFIAEPGR